MANRAALLNSAVLSSDIYGLNENAGKPGNDLITFCEAAYRIPIPWLCCFRQQDLRTAIIPMDADDSAFDEPAVTSTQVPLAPSRPASEELPIPCTSVAQALLNLEQARPLMVEIAGNADIARDYYDEMVYYLKALPLPYLTMDPLEVVFMSDPNEWRRNIVGALSGTPSAIPYLKRLSCFEDGTKPHAFEVTTSVSGFGRGDPGNENSIALSSNARDYYWHLDRDQEQPKHDLPWFKPAHRGMRLDDIERALAAELTGIDESPSISTQARVADNHSWGQASSVLDTYIHVESDMTAYAIFNHRGFRQQLDAKYRAMFVDWCQRHGFTWRGVAVISRETIDNEYDGSYSKAQHEITPLDIWRDPGPGGFSWLRKLMGK
jgi:hypothetical protein